MRRVFEKEGGVCCALRCIDWCRDVVMCRRGGATSTVEDFFFYSEGERKGRAWGHGESSGGRGGDHRVVGFLELDDPSR